MSVETIEVGHASGAVDDVDLLVVGGPTHAFGMSRPATRESAVEQAETAQVRSRQARAGTVSTRIGIREWLAGKSRDDTAKAVAAAFDTKVGHHFTGSAARGAAKRLRALEFRLALPPESFIVKEVDGPLADGEVERARQWGKVLAAAVLDAHIP